MEKGIQGECQNNQGGIETEFVRIGRRFPKKKPSPWQHVGERLCAMHEDFFERTGNGSGIALGKVGQKHDGEGGESCNDSPDACRVECSFREDFRIGRKKGNGEKRKCQKNENRFVQFGDGKKPPG